MHSFEFDFVICKITELLCRATSIMIQCLKQKMPWIKINASKKEKVLYLKAHHLKISMSKTNTRNSYVYPPPPKKKVKLNREKSTLINSSECQNVFVGKGGGA